VYNLFQRLRKHGDKSMNSAPTMTIETFVKTVQNMDTIFGVSFVKKTDGSIRNMTARMHVKKGVKGALPKGHRESEDKRNRVLTVYDMNVLDEGGEKGAFRRINLSQLLSCTVRGTKYEYDKSTGLLVRS